MAAPSQRPGRSSRLDSVLPDDRDVLEPDRGRLRLHPKRRWYVGIFAGVLAKSIVARTWRSSTLFGGIRTAFAGVD